MNVGDEDAAGARAVDWIVEVDGTVQGVGFRPFVARTSARLGVHGWVRNTAAGVTIRAIGPGAAVRQLVATLRESPPLAAQVAAVRVRASAAQTDGPPGAEAAGPGMAIVASEVAAAASVAVTPDLAICVECRRELADPRDRRHGYPFINCTNCGPRYSIVQSLPYDRARTTMAAFTMCAECAREFRDPADRRYHAQPNACPACGPHLTLETPAGAVLARHAAAVTGAVDCIALGRIVAVKGIGGFHLMADATNLAAVDELRRRKRRAEKPFAVMFGSLDALCAEADVTAEQAAALTSPIAPIVLVRRRANSPLTGSIAPGNPWIGAILAYSPLHLELTARARFPLVATSGNIAEEPLCTDNAEARRRLRDVADTFLLHDRPIARPIDDSVVRYAGSGPVWLRRARGLAPSPLSFPDGTTPPSMLCLGGHLKSTIAVTVGSNLVLSPHIGDLGNPVTEAAFRQAIALLGSLHGSQFDTVVCDEHPDYRSTRYAESLGLPVVRVQHHLAHILACLMEHGGGPSRVLGVAWDGTGYGSDGTIWGGEFIVVDRASGTARRLAHLWPFRLPGGETAIREPRRSALALLHAAFDGDRRRLEPWVHALGFAAGDGATLLTLLDRGIHAPITTSAGRLFDGVAALLGLRPRSSFEAQAAMELEFAAEGQPATTPPWEMLVTGDRAAGPWVLDWRPVVRELVNQRHTRSVAWLSARFHATLAAGIVAVAGRAGIDTVVLTGGCFQNVRLLDAAVAALRATGTTVLCHRRLPPNDGAIAAGQALAAAWRITRVQAESTPGRE